MTSGKQNNAKAMVLREEIFDKKSIDRFYILLENYDKHGFYDYSLNHLLDNHLRIGYLRRQRIDH